MNHDLIKKNLTSYSRKYGLREDQKDDFIQHAFERILKENTIQNFYYYLIDTARTNTDRSKQHNQYIKKSQIIDEKATARFVTNKPNARVAVSDFKLSYRLNMEDFLYTKGVYKKIMLMKEVNQTKQIARAVFIFKEKHGMLLTEIAQALGVSESRACQYYKVYIDLLKKRLLSCEQKTN